MEVRPLSVTPVMEFRCISREVRHLPDVAGEVPRMRLDVRGKRLDGHAVLLSQRGKVAFMRRVDVYARSVSHRYLTNEINRTRPARQMPTARIFSIVWSLTWLSVLKTR